MIYNAHQVFPPNLFAIRAQGLLTKMFDELFFQIEESLYLSDKFVINLEIIFNLIIFNFF